MRAVEYLSENEEYGFHTHKQTSYGGAVTIFNKEWQEILKEYIAEYFLLGEQ